MQRIAALAVVCAVALVPLATAAQSRVAPLPAPSYTPLPTAAPVPPPTATPVPTADPATIDRARAEFLAWQNGAPDREHYSANMQTSMSPDVIAATKTLLASYGAPATFTVIQRMDAPVASGYEFAVSCANGTAYETISPGGAGKIATIYFSSAP